MTTKATKEFDELRTKVETQLNAKAKPNSCETCRFDCEHEDDGTDYPNMPPDYCIDGSLWQPSEKVKPNCCDCEHLDACQMQYSDLTPDFVKTHGLRCDSWELAE